jgi:hypothetical protein
MLFLKLDRTYDPELLIYVTFNLYYPGPGVILFFVRFGSVANLSPILPPKREYGSLMSYLFGLGTNFEVFILCKKDPNCTFSLPNPKLGVL